MILNLALVVIYILALANYGNSVGGVYNLNLQSSNNVASPIDFDVCLSTAYSLSSISTNGKFFQLYNYNSGSIGSQIPSSWPFLDTISPSAVKIVYSSNSAIYAYIAHANTTNSYITVSNIGLSTIVSNLAVGNPVSVMLLDPDFPLLYFAGINSVGILNINNPESPYIVSLWNPSIPNTFSVYGPTSMALSGTKVYVTNNAANCSAIGSVLFFDVSAAGTSLNVSGNLAQVTSNERATVVRSDWNGNYLAVASSLGLYFLKLIIPNSLVQYFPAIQDVSDVAFMSQSEPLISRLSSGSSSVLLNSLNTTDTPLQFACSSATFNFHDGYLYTAGNSCNSTAVYQVTRNSALLAGPVQAACNISNTKASVLQFSTSGKVVIDVQNIRPISTLQMNTFSGANRRLRWNDISYTVVSNTTSTDRFRVFNNMTKSFYETLSFTQNQIDDGLVYIYPSNSNVNDCKSNSLNFNTYSTNITFNASDAFGRSLPLTTLQYAMVCCPNMSATVSPSISATTALFSTVQNICTAPAPGYYMDAITQKITACPSGTFSPYITASTCVSCPDGSVSATASSNVLNCSSGYSYVPGPWNPQSSSGQLSYFFPAQSLVGQSPTTKPIFVVATITGQGPLAIALTRQPMTNGSTAGPSSKVYQVLFGQLGTSLTSESTNFATYNSNLLSPESKVTVWVFWYQGLLVAGVVPYGVDLRTDLSFINNTLINNLATNNFSAIDASAFRPNFSYNTSYTNSISSIGFGVNSTSKIVLSNIWAAQVSDYIGSYKVSNSGTMLTSSFVSTKIDYMLFSILPPMTVSWYLGNFPAPWIDQTSNIFDFSIDKYIIGTYADIYVTNGLSNSLMWTRTTNFTWQQLQSKQVYLKMRTSQMLLPSSIIGNSWFSINFRVLNRNIRMPNFVIQNYNVSLPPIAQNAPFQVSSWNITNSVYPSPRYNYLASVPYGQFTNSSSPGYKVNANYAFGTKYAYIFGGITGYGSANSTTGNDMWQYDPNSGLFALLSGTGLANVSQNSTTQESSENTPGPSQTCSMVTDPNETYLYISFCDGWASDTIWRFNLGTYKWLRLQLTGATLNTPYSQLVFQGGTLKIVDTQSQAIYVVNLNTLTVSLQASFSGDPSTSGAANYGLSSNMNSLFIAGGLQWNGGSQNEIVSINVANFTSTAIIPSNANSVVGFSQVYRANTSNVILGLGSSVVKDDYNNMLYTFGGYTLFPLQAYSNALYAHDVNLKASFWLSGGFYNLSNHQVPQSISNQNGIGYIDANTMQDPFSQNIVSGSIYSKNPLKIDYLGADNCLVQLSYISGGILNSGLDAGVAIATLQIYIMKPSTEVSTPTYNLNFWTAQSLTLKPPMLQVYFISTNGIAGNPTFDIAFNNASDLGLPSQISYDAFSSGTYSISISRSKIGSTISFPFQLITGNTGNQVDNVTGSITVFVDCYGLNVNSTSCNCSSGSYLYQGVCTLCPADYYKGNDGNGNCSSCPLGSSTQGQTGGTSVYSCTPKVGFARANSSFYYCNLGYYYQNGDCKQCPANSYSSSYGFSPCISCPAHTSTYGQVGSVSSSSCITSPTFVNVNGISMCDLGNYYNSSTQLCSPCTVDTYQNNYNVLSSCTPCPSGSFTNNSFGSTSIAGCIALPNFVNVNGAFMCDSGYYFQSSPMNCTACPENTYLSQPSSATTCDACPAGSYTNGNIGRANCVAKPGFVVLNMQAQEFGCPPGTTLSNDGSTCIACPSDSYKVSSSFEPCSACPRGTSTFSYSGYSSDCLPLENYTLVNSQFYCQQGYTPSGKYCVSCPENSYKTTIGNDSCTLCDSGKTSNGVTGCKASSCCVASLQNEQASVSGSSSSSSVGLAIGASVGGIVVFGILAALLIYRISKSKKSKSKSVIGTKPIVHSNSFEKPGMAPISALSKLSRVETAQSSSDNLSKSFVSLSQTQRVVPVTRTIHATRGFQAGAHSVTKTAFISDQLVMAFPGFLLINGSGYEAEEVIAEGGFAKLYTGRLTDNGLFTRQSNAINTEDNSKVAIKIFKVPTDASPEVFEEQKDDLENEATVMYALTCLPNIAKLYAVSESPELALIMKLYDDSLSRIIHASVCPIRDLAMARCKNSWIGLASKLIVDFVNGISAMHVMQISHLDIKPPNMLIEVTPNSEELDVFPIRAVIADFGLARFNNDLAACKRITRKLTTGISLPYAAPEAFSIVRLLGNGVPIGRSSFVAMDSYSTAVTIWETLARKKPLLDVPLQDIERALLAGKKPSLRDLPAPGDSNDAELLKAMIELMEGGWTTRLETRLTVQEMLDILKDKDIFTS